MSEAALLALFVAVEAEQGIPSGLLQAVCRVESGMNPQAVNHKDGNDEQSSIGLCQVKYLTAREHSKAVRSPQSLYDPRTNVSAAGAYLRWQYGRYGSWERALVAYNRGSSSGPCNQYCRRVLREWRSQ